MLASVLIHEKLSQHKVNDKYLLRIVKPLLQIFVVYPLSAWILPDEIKFILFLIVIEKWLTDLLFDWGIHRSAWTLFILLLRDWSALFPSVYLRRIYMIYVLNRQIFHQKVFWLEIPMNDAFIMDISDPVQHLVNNQ